MSDLDQHASSAPATRTRRRPRLPAEEVRERMFSAAKNMIRDRGVLISLEDIRLEEVVHTAGVPRSRAYRLWPYKGDFVNDLLMHLAGPDWMGTSGFDPETLFIASDVVLQHWDLLETTAGREAVVREVVRQAVGRNMNGILQSVEWETYVALVATARGSSNDETRQQLNVALEQTEALLVSLMSDFYATICDAVGLRLRDDALTYSHLAVAGAAVIEGIALRTILARANATSRGDWGKTLEDVLGMPMPGPAVDGGLADWTIAAWAYLGILDAATEQIPDWEPTSERRAKVEELRDRAREASALSPIGS